MTPAEFCAALLAALEASEGRRRSRKRDQTPDRIGLEMKRALLERAVREAPPAEAFEAWLLAQGSHPLAPTVLDEWRMLQALPRFSRWLEGGAPSDDTRTA
jgi:hypothetical protein